MLAYMHPMPLLCKIKMYILIKILFALLSHIGSYTCLLLVLFQKRRKTNASAHKNFTTNKIFFMRNCKDKDFCLFQILIMIDLKKG